MIQIADGVPKSWVVLALENGDPKQWIGERRDIPGAVSGDRIGLRHRTVEPLEKELGKAFRLISQRVAVDGNDIPERQPARRGSRISHQQIIRSQTRPQTAHTGYVVFLGDHVRELLDELVDPIADSRHAVLRVDSRWSKP